MESGISYIKDTNHFLSKLEIPGKTPENAKVINTYKTMPDSSDSDDFDFEIKTNLLDNN